MKKYEEARGNVIKFQALCRGYLMRQKIAEQLKAVCVIQAYARGMFVRKSLHKMKKVGKKHGNRNHSTSLVHKNCAKERF